MRLTIGGKIAWALVIIVLIGTLAMVVIYDGLGRLAGAMRELAETKEPANAAAYEMEIQLHAIGLAVLRYLDTGDPAIREEVAAGDAQFDKYHHQYLRLIDTPEARALATKIRARYSVFKALGADLLAAKDAQERRLHGIGEGFEKIDQVIEQLMPTLPRRTAVDSLVGRGRERELFLRVEAEVAEVGLWLANYQRVRKVEYRDLIFQKEQELLGALKVLAAADLTPEQQRARATLAKLFSGTMSLIRDALRDDEALRERIREFSALRAEIDELLDGEVQVLAVQGMGAPVKAADEAAARVLAHIPYLLFLFAAAAVGVGFVLTRTVTTSVRALADGAAVVGRGDLSHRIAARSRDELADLTAEFNRMVERLAATTVSKERLEVSERQLQDLVTRFQQEISERRRADEERVRLETSLRRAETMSALGAVVAGVAHEARNPLFGISSVLDAMEARLGNTPEYREYVAVLREQGNRLTRLMRDLLEYGRPVTRELSVEAIDTVLNEAARLCEDLRKRRDVPVVARLESRLPPIAIDGPRLLRAFANILENAIQHSPPGGLVTVEARGVDAEGRLWVESTITDAGPGIPAEDLGQIFEPFFTRRRGGTGLGLPIVQRIVEEHGGRVSAANRPDGGAVMTVLLPAAS